MTSLLLIYEHIDHFQEAIDLSVTCKSLRVIGRNRVNALLLPVAGHWAGDRIICVGDYAQNDDMPPGLLTEDEKQQIRELCSKPFDGTTRKDGKLEEEEDDEGSASLYNLASDRFAKRSCSQLGIQYCIQSAIWYPDARRYDKLWYPKKNAQTTTAPSPLQWALCNLSKREYVQSDTIGDFPSVKQLGYFEFLLSRICWSSDPSISMCYRGTIHRGVWAGDRFEITTIDRLEGGEAEWKDVGEEMTKEMAAIWESDYGEGWKLSV